MQITAYCEEKTYTEEKTTDHSPILHFSLQHLLPEGNTLALNMPLGTLSCLIYTGGQPRLLLQQQFTRSELSLLLPLLQSFPYYCPYEVLFSSFYNSQISETLIVRSRNHLQRALETGTWEQEMRPVRNVLSRTRLKLRTFGINISSILETGCILMVVRDSQSEYKAG